VIGAVSVELLSRGMGTTVPAVVNLLFAVAGLPAGLVYWHVAVRYDGRDRRDGKDPV
jgi:hypothetical protein